MRKDWDVMANASSASRTFSSGLVSSQPGTGGRSLTAACAAIAVIGLSSVVCRPAVAQVTTIAPVPVPGAKPVRIERIKVHSAAIEGNLEGENPDRDVLVVLPPSYGTDTTLRYPVIYALHGYSVGAEQWSKEIHVAPSVEAAFAKGSKEAIIVLPDSKTVHNGSMYSRSMTTGDFELFVARDLIRYVDSHYRTIAHRESRGLVGHSMGGYGAARIGMNHPDVFGALYLMSPCCLAPRLAQPANAETEAALAAVKSIDDAKQLPWGLRATLAAAAAWSPNPEAPPLYLDLPVKNGNVDRDVEARWAANAPLAFVDQHIADLRQYRAIAMDVGDKDGLKADTEKLHAVLTRYKISNTLQVYAGDHTSHIGVRFQDKVLPFFSNSLDFGSAAASRANR